MAADVLPDATRNDRTAENTVVIGIGEPFRRDDGVGIRVAQLVQARRVPGIRVEMQNGEATALMTCWEGCGRIVLIDAVRCGAPPGTIHRFAGLPERPAEFLRKRSTHQTGVEYAFALARALHRLPRQTIVYGIEGRSFEFGCWLSPAVERAARRLARRIAADLCPCLPPHLPPSRHFPCSAETVNI